MGFQRNATYQRWLVAILIVAAIWLGMLLGVSFLATPVKFLAPSLSLPVALDVGRHTFAIFSKVEWLLSAALLVVVLAGDRAWACVSAMIAAALIVVTEAIWLLPLLDQRVGLIIAGEVPEPSHLHNLYIVFELAKLLALSLVVLFAARKLSGSLTSPYSMTPEER